MTVAEAPRYEVSSLGRVRNAETSALIASRVRKDGYVDFNLRVDVGERVRRCGHQLVAAAFLGPRPPEATCAAHKDGSRDNNTPDNIYWATTKQNHADRERHGRAPIGSRNGRAKLTEREVAAIKRRVLAGDPLKAIAADFGAIPTTICNIKAGRSWTHVAAEEQA